MKLLNIITTLSLIYIFTSCEKPLEYDGEQLDPILILFSECHTGDTLTCHLSKSEFFLNEVKDFRVEGAVVSWRVNSGDWQEMSFHKSIDDENYYDENIKTSNSIYKSDYVIQANDHIELRASYMDFETIYAQHTAPEHPNIEYVKIDTLDHHSYRITARLAPYEGTPGVIDYLSFSVEYAVEYKFVNDDFSWSDYYEDFTSDDPLLVKYKDLNISSVFEDSDEYYQLTLPVDALTEPHEFVFEITTEKYYHPLQENETATLIALKLNYSALSDEYYKAHKSMELQSNNANNPFVEKSQIYSNIENGAGLFSIAGYDTDWIFY